MSRWRGGTNAPRNEPQAGLNERSGIMRLFFALWPPESVALALAGQAEVLAQQYGGKATRCETIHLTLAFLGEVDEALLPAAIQAAQAVRGAHFVLTVDRLGYWRHNRLIWAGCAAPDMALQQLVIALREQLREVSIGCDERLRFTPHLTLVRKVPGACRPVELATIEPVAWTCERFVLVCSRLTSAGSDYSMVAEFPLASR